MTDTTPSREYKYILTLSSPLTRDELARLNDPVVDSKVLKTLGTFLEKIESAA